MAAAAIESGADEVYIGLLHWSLRSPCFEMGVDQLRQVYDHATPRGVTVRVALNTYPWEDDLPAFDREISRLRDMGISSFILADIGSIHAVRRNHPDAYIQASVAADVRNLHDVEALQAAGADSVTLLKPSPDFVRRVKRETGMKVEVFAYGYLNYTYRARCYMSGYIRHAYTPGPDSREQASGSFNREGFCNRACKCQWTIVNGQPEAFGVTMNSYPFVAIADLVDLLHAGIDGLKIQGRENSVDLVREAVRLYRGILNGYRANPAGFAIPDAVAESARRIDRIRHEEMRSRSAVMIREMLGVTPDAPNLVQRYR
jgi:putative protease